MLNFLKVIFFYLNVLISFFKVLKLKDDSNGGLIQIKTILDKATSG